VNALSSSETKTIRQYVISKRKRKLQDWCLVGYPVPGHGHSDADESGNELGPNQIGEMQSEVGISARAIGKKPDLTNAAFRLDPSCPGSRTFCTGEWGRLSPDGCLEHLDARRSGKKFGYRVETYETELALLRHPAVDQVLVLCRETDAGINALSRT